MDGVHDMGGKAEHYGPLKPLDPAEKAFHEPWEGRAFAVTLLANRAATASNLHAFRHALERVPEKEYLADYYGRWLGSAEILLVDSGLIAEGAVGARARTLRGETVQEPADPTPNKPTMESGGGGNMRATDATPAFAVGDRVTTSSDAASGHTRLPGYARGKPGVITALRPSQIFPDTVAHFIGEKPQHVYSVTYDAGVLWGEGSEPFTLTMDLYEDYLERVQ